MNFFLTQLFKAEGGQWDIISTTLSINVNLPSVLPLANGTRAFT